ncbi:hypothetical protein BRM1_07545 [Brevibacterium sp. BRM-1]|uniref:hypothetical protein n=1 Tax=Brevibacterium sp. BRM-1 TaxID=2999062 RepID=UPI0022828B05|nr:hypothetical protein [Brevibacterium sp. BRM-1]WAL39155.1 hypothetical protein BRM1_07545 [Brevibacterium sp. BRM-1]
MLPAAKTLRTALTSTAAAIALVAGSAVVATAPAEAASRHHCSASVSNSRPHRGQNLVVRVSKVPAKVTVSAVAKYKTTSTGKRAKASKKGKALLHFNVGGGTVGRRVPVQVVAKKGKSTWTCSTSFVPTRKR